METQIKVKKHKLTPGFFFLSLGVLITLITSVVSFLNLAFSTLDKKFPDILNSSYQYGYYSYDYENIRVALATLIIFFPVFLIVAYFWKRFTKQNLGSVDHIIKKWLIYIIIFLSGLVIIIDLVVLVKYFVAGEITNRFIYKIVVTLLTASLAGKYFYVAEVWNIKEKTKKILLMIYGVLSIVLVLGAIIYSFNIMGSPSKQRMLRLDDRRVNDLINLQSQIIGYWQQKEKLPTDLKVLSNPMTGYSLPVAPNFTNGEVYEYTIKDKNKLSFELCATFALPMPKGWHEYGKNSVMPMMDEVNVETVNIRDVYSTPSGNNDSWDHGVGRTCYERIIDKDIYPPFSKIKN